MANVDIEVEFEKLVVDIEASQFEFQVPVRKEGSWQLNGMENLKNREAS